MSELWQNTTLFATVTNVAEPFAVLKKYEKPLVSIRIYFMLLSLNWLLWNPKIFPTAYFWRPRYSWCLPRQLLRSIRALLVGDVLFEIHRCYWSGIELSGHNTLCAGARQDCCHGFWHDVGVFADLYTQSDILRLVVGWFVFGVG